METLSAEEKAVKDWINETFKPGLSREEAIARYEDWSSNYDEMLGQGRYRGPEMLAMEAARMVPEDRRKQMRVLDVAAGTGLVGRELLKRGFTNLDALEPVEGMMKVLKERGIYSLKYQEFIGLGESTVPKDTYDLVVTCGSIGDNLVPIKGIDDMIQFTKPGGLVIIASDLSGCNSTENDAKKIASYIDQLEEKGMWRKEEKKMMPNFYFGEEGLYLICRVL